MQQHTGDVRFIGRCSELAARGPLVDANPQVGAVILDADGRQVGEGWHEGAGSPHAEAQAIAAAGERCRGGTAYVSLEPCAHHGRTAPCAAALVASGVRRVVFAVPDPTPEAAGGAAYLRAAGVQVDQVSVPEAESLNRYWTFAQSRRRPFVTWKVAATLDGRVAAADGTSRWITGTAARRDVHRRRGTCGAIAVGTGTVLADDPALTVRTADDQPLPHQPLRVVIGSSPIPSTAAVRADDHLLCLSDSPAAVLAQLHDRQIRHLWLEGGPRLAASFLTAGLVDEVVLYVAARFLGAGPSLVGDLGITSLASALSFEFTEVLHLGADLALIARPQNRGER